MTTTQMKPTVQRRRLAAKLRNLRAEAGISPEQVMEELDWSRSKLSRIETASNRISVPDVRALCAIYGASPELTDGLCWMSKQSKRRGWWHAYDDAMTDYFSDYLELEAEAVAITTYQIDLVPGLFQTAEYAQRIVRAWAPDIDDEQVRRRAEVRLTRQARINDGIPIWAVIDEAALRRPCGPENVMKEQLLHLVEVARLPNVTIQIMPFSAGAHASMGTGFIYLEFEALYDPVVFLDTLTCALYLEDMHEVARYSLAIKHVQASALDPRDSLEMLERISGQVGSMKE